MPDKWPLANGNWSNAANWNGGTKPVAGDDVYADGRTLNVDESFDVATLRSTQRSGGTVGGSFIFNTAGVTGTVTSSSPLFSGATNLIQVTATTGTVTISLGGAIESRAVANEIIINHSGNCNLNLNGTDIRGVTSANVGGTSCISKTSSGLITITANLISGTRGSGGVGNNRALFSTSGNTLVIGNVTGGSSTNTGNQGINQSVGTLTITGNIIGGQGISSNQGVVFTGTSLTVTGTVTGGVAAVAIDSASPINIINGNIIGGPATAISVTGNTIINGNMTANVSAALFSSSSNSVSVTGTVTASASAPAINMTNANGQVYLNGNMVNNNGKVAIYAPIIWLDKNNTTSAAFFTSGGGNRTLYSADTVPNTPAVNNVRQGTVFGAGNSLTGTIEMPVAADVRNGVVFDNGSVGTALFTTALFLTELNASTDPVAVRLKNAATPDILGELMEAYKKS